MSPRSSSTCVPQPQLPQVGRTEVQVLSKLCGDRVGQRGPQQAALALHVPVELGPREQALGRAATQGQPLWDGTALGHRDSHQRTGQGWERGTATTEWDWTRTQEQPPQDGTAVRHRDSHHRASRASSSPQSSPCRQVTLQKVKGGDTPAVLYTMALQPLQNRHQRGCGRLDQVPHLLQGQVLPWEAHRGYRSPHRPRGSRASGTWPLPYCGDRGSETAWTRRTRRAAPRCRRAKVSCTGCPGSTRPAWAQPGGTLQGGR